MTQYSIPFVDLRPRYLEEREALLAIFDRVAGGGQVILGPEVEQLEANVSMYTGARHCIGVSSGTDALILGLRAIGLRPGDEVITAPNSFIASAASIAQAGGVPAFADLGEDQNMSPVDLERRITPRTRAIMPVHWTGRVADMDAIQAIADHHGLIVVEDSAQAMGSYYRGRHGGTFGRFGAISCHPLKNLGAIGDGGLLLTSDDDVAAKVRLYRNHGLIDRDTCAELAVNARLDALQAGILSYRLQRLDATIEARRKNVALYRQLLVQGPIYTPEEKPDERSSYVMFLIQAERRDALKQHLADHGIESLVYYGRPLHLHPATRHLGYKEGDFPVAERQAARVLALPHHQCLSEDQIAHIAETVNRFYA
jgi:dTDP-4-amino-4,6-dideoxygalactose transaminase